MLIKIIMVLCLSLSLIGCDNKEPEEPIHNDGTSGETVKDPEEKVDKNVISKMIYDYAIEIYKNKAYTKYPKTNGRHVITLNQLKDDFKYEITYIKTIDDLTLDVDNSYIEIDIDNLDKVEYKEYPIMMTLVYE